MFRVALRDPVSWAAFGAAALFAAALLWWFPVGLLGALPPILLALIASFVWLIVFARSGGYARILNADRTARTHAAAQRLHERIAALSQRFDALGHSAGREQLTTLDQKFASALEVIEARLDAGEMARGRYLDVAEQVYLAAIDNLSEAEIALRSVNAVDPQKARAQIADLVSDEAHDAAEQVAKRVALHERQWERVRALMAENERAMTALLEAATLLAETRTAQGGARVSADRAIAELEALAAASSRHRLED